MQIAFAALIMLAFGSYVWLIQLQYDEAAKATAWTGRIWMPIFYAITVSAAGFSYDCAKSILFLEQGIFKQFVTLIFEAFAFLILIIFLMLAAFYLLNFSTPGARFFGQLSYLTGLAATWYAIQSTSRAITLAANAGGSA